MKKHLLPLLAAAMCCSLSSQAQIYELNIAGPPFTAFSPTYVEVQFGDTNQVFSPMSKTEFSYVNPGKPGLQTGFDYQQGSFSPYHRRATTYDGLGRTTEIRDEFLNNGSWNWTYSQLFEYDALGNLTKETDSSSSSGTQIMSYNWTYLNNRPTEVEYVNSIGPYFRQRYSYNTGGELDTIFKEELSPSTGATLVGRKTFAWHDFSQKKPSYIKEEYIDAQTGSLQYSTEWEIAYYANDTMERAKLDYIYPPNMVLPSRRTYYDQDGFPSSDSLFVYDQFQLKPNSSVWMQHTWQFNQNQRSQLDRTNTTFSGEVRTPIRYIFGEMATSAAAPTSQFAMQIFPNPVSQTLHIQMEEESRGLVNVALFDLAGRLRMEMSSPGNQTLLDLTISEQLESGTYLCKVSTSKGSATQKIIVRR